MVQARAFKVLFSDINRATKEPTIRYQRQTSVGLENVDLASNWEEVSIGLEVRACLEDKEEIERQVNAIYESATTEAQKQQLDQQLTDYLQQRAKDLEKLGGKESPVYVREKNIVGNVIEKYKLSTSQTQTTFSIPVATSQPQPVAIKMNGVSDTQPVAVVNTSDSNNKINFEQLEKLIEMYSNDFLNKEEFLAAKVKLSRDNFKQLEKLVDMYSDDFLYREEFLAAKAKLLGM
ncbi:hypothetical protein NIES4102_36190 [Chondrocystis sp. NIES-4102]|nr:hypothetical protein NIES4102_36190 [Chondrocystis sp. NIES-4102]